VEDEWEYSPNVSEPCGSHLNEIIFCYPSVPVSLKCCQRGVLVLQLPKRILINDRIIVRIEKEARRYPRLHQTNSERRTNKKCGVMMPYLKHEPSSAGKLTLEISQVS
jgi:hypothetical protein